MTGAELMEDTTALPAGHCPHDRRVMRPLAPLETVAALYVEPRGCYVGVPGVDPWDEARDARQYAGPHPVVAHPPCQRWGRFWHGSTRKPHQYQLGDDGGCFRAALAAIRRYGGVLEHPADSRAWDVHGMTKPPRPGGWVKVDPLADRDDVPQEWKDDRNMWTCCVYQGHYGHPSGKATWLVTAGIAREDLPELKWGKTEQRLPAWMIERYGYEKARRIGVVAMVGGKNKTAIRNATPEPFRDLLLSIARRAHNTPMTAAPRAVD
jgi:hypothetical protein